MSAFCCFSPIFWPELANKEGRGQLAVPRLIPVNFSDMPPYKRQVTRKGKAKKRVDLVSSLKVTSESATESSESPRLTIRVPPLKQTLSSPSPSLEPIPSISNPPSWSTPISSAPSYTDDCTNTGAGNHNTASGDDATSSKGLIRRRNRSEKASTAFEEEKRGTKRKPPLRATTRRTTGCSTPMQMMTA